MTQLPSVLLLCAAAIPAQSFLELPASANPAQELPNYGLPPFAYSNARVQMFFDANEVGATNFTATGVSFRWDGPLPQVGAPGPFTIQRLRIGIGTTAVALPEARFAANLTSALTPAFDSPVTYFPDPGSASPHGWGDPNGSLSFAFAAPVPISIPAGGWLVLDIAMENNNFSMFGFAHTLLDGIATTGGPSDGQAASFGQGCAISGSTTAPTIGTEGVRAPGTAHFVTGQHLGANAPVFVIYGLSNTQSSLGPLPFRLPGTVCDLLVSLDAPTLTFADATGSLTASSGGNVFAVPADPVYAGLVLHEQLAPVSFGVNPYGIALSDAQTVTLGTLTQPGIGVYAVANGQDANATIATDVQAFGYAVRLSTL